MNALKPITKPQSTKQKGHFSEGTTGFPKMVSGKTLDAKGASRDGELRGGNNSKTRSHRKKVIAISKFQKGLWPPPGPGRSI